MNAIAQRAGVSKGNLFHHFRSKDALYLAVLAGACRQSLQALDELQNSGPWKERLHRLAQTQLRIVLERACMSRLMLQELLNANGQRSEELAQQVFGENFAALVDLIREGQREGALRAQTDPALVAALLIGANVFFFEARAILRHFPAVSFADEPERYSAMVIELLLHGLAADHGSGSKKTKRP